MAQRHVLCSTCHPKPSRLPRPARTMCLQSAESGDRPLCLREPMPVHGHLRLSAQDKAYPSAFAPCWPDASAAHLPCGLVATTDFPSNLGIDREVALPQTACKMCTRRSRSSQHPDPGEDLDHNTRTSVQVEQFTTPCAITLLRRTYSCSKNQPQHALLPSTKY